MLYLCVGALVCGLPLGPKHQNKDMEYSWDYQIKCYLFLPIEMFVHNVHGVVDDIHT